MLILLNLSLGEELHDLLHLVGISILLGLLFTCSHEVNDIISG